MPLDYSQGCSPNINIFYRMIPAYGSQINDKSKPIIVVMNGGPGAPSSVYRSLNFDYSKPNPNIFDRFKYLLINYRILLVDQRGTDGLSLPIDFTNRG